MNKPALNDGGTNESFIREITQLAAPCKLNPGLYIVATPIGNLGDITLRALSVLQSADFIACEDTRTTRNLLSVFHIKGELLSYHDHNEAESAGGLVNLIQKGGAVALVSDAGLPLVSDPGYRIVQAALSENISITVVPGANAATAALCLSGLEPAPFLFLGFLPQKGKRGKVEEWKNHSGTIVLYEAPHRLVETLALLAEVWGDRKAAVVRELTKKFEEAKRGPLSELQAYYEANEPRGEITLVVQGASDDAVAGEDIEKELAAALAKFSLKEAVQYVAGATGAPRKEVYKRALEMQKK